MKTTLTVEKETWKDLILIKIAMGVDTIDDVINRLILNYKTNVEKQKEEE